MVEALMYPTESFPKELECQVLSFQRIHWSDGFRGPNLLRDWIHSPETHPVHFVLVEQGILISYTGVVWKYLEHAGETYKTYGLSGVLTYPAFRRQGYGRQVVDAATRYIEGSDADLGLFTCAPRLRPFYAASGWQPMDRVTLYGGPKDQPYPNDELVMMGFFSERARQNRATFESTPIFFDADLW